MYKYRFIFLFLLVGNFFLVYAQENIEVIEINSFEETFDYASKNNPDLKVYKLQQEEAQSVFKTAKSYRRPTISGVFSGQYNINLQTTPLPGEIFGQPGQTINAQFGTAYAYNAGINASYDVLSWQKKINAQIAKTNIEILQSQEQSYLQTLKEQVALYYYGAIITQQALKINQKDSIAADSVLMLTQQKFEEGLISKVTLNQAQLNVNNIQQSIANNQKLLDQYLHQLGILTGFPANTSLKLKEEIKNISIQTASPQLSQNLAMQVLEKQKAQSEMNIKLEQAAFLPSLTINSYLGQQQFRDEFGLSFSNDAWSSYSYLGLNLSIPIFSGFSKKNKVRTAQIRSKIAEDQYIELQRKTDIQDRLLLKNYQNSQLLVQNSYKNVQLLAESSKLTFDKYQEGLLSLDVYFTDNFGEVL